MSDWSSFVKRSFDIGLLCVLVCVVLGWLKYNEVKTVKSMSQIHIFKEQFACVSKISVYTTC